MIHLRLSAFTFLLLLSSPSASHSQANTGISLGGGIIYYTGDLTDKSSKVFASSVFFHPYASLGVTHWFSGYLEGSAFLLHGKVDGADSLSKEKSNLRRNLSFTSDIDEFLLRFEINTSHRYERRRINLFAFAGASVFRFNPKANLNGTWYELQPLGTEGQYIENGGYAKPYKLIQPAIPIGFGITVLAGRKIRVKAEFCHRILFTDFLDDVSTIYPDLEALSANPGGDIAVALSNRRPDGNTPAINSLRGNPDSNDALSHFGISLIYNPGISTCPATFKSTRIKHRK